MSRLKKLLVKILVLLMAVGQSGLNALAATQVRVKDIVDFEGVRDNQLVGYGLVVGLNGTGDTVASVPYTKESLTSMLERLGVNIRDGNAIAGKNIAAVMVTATLPPFARQGTRVDVTVSALGDAKDLRGGTLLVTPLLAADGSVYAVAQGQLAVGGFNAEGKSGSKITKGVPTSAKISNGAIVEKEVGFELAHMNKMHLSLKNPDFTTAKRISDIINKKYAGLARAVDLSTVAIDIPAEFRGKMVDFLTIIEQLTITPDQVAKIIIDEQNGVVVMGENIRISTVAVTQGNITIRITETPQVSQPNPFTNVPTATVVDRSDLNIREEKGKLAVIGNGVSLQDLVNGLNSLGVTPQDLISILRSIKAAGALQGEIEII